MKTEEKKLKHSLKLKKKEETINKGKEQDKRDIFSAWDVKRRDPNFFLW